MVMVMVVVVVAVTVVVVMVMVVMVTKGRERTKGPSRQKRMQTEGCMWLENSSLYPLRSSDVNPYYYMTN